jgi:hypothetical protein
LSSVTASTAKPAFRVTAARFDGVAEPADPIAVCGIGDLVDLHGFDALVEDDRDFADVGHVVIAPDFEISVVAAHAAARGHDGLRARRGVSGEGRVVQRAGSRVERVIARTVCMGEEIAARGLQPDVVAVLHARDGGLAARHGFAVVVLVAPPDFLNGITAAADGGRFAERFSERGHGQIRDRNKIDAACRQGGSAERGREGGPAAPGRAER